METGRFWVYAAYNFKVTETQRFWSRKDVTCKVNAQQPTAHVRCTRLQNDELRSVRNIFNMMTTQIPFNDLWNTVQFDTEGHFDAVTYDYSEDSNKSRVPNLTWATIPQGGGTALGALISFPISKSSSVLLSCTIDARLIPVTMENTRSDIRIAKGVPDGPYGNENTYPRYIIDPK